MNTSVESLTHKMQRAAVGKMVDVVLSHADKDRQKTVGQLVDCLLYTSCSLLCSKYSVVCDEQLSHWKVK